MKTPVIFIIFNRPDSTQKVFDAIRRAEPEKLLVIADGPRTNRDGEAEKCSITRGIIDQVDWKCKVINNFSEQNMGCAKRISSGLDWAFSIVEEAIILEDDCIPEPTFFSFCEELLERYRDDKRIASISGQNVQFGRKRTNYSYYFSCFNHCWGWATWRRAWQHFDFEITLWPEVRDQNFLVDILGEPHAVNYWSNVFQSLYEGTSRQDSWAQRWTLSCWLQNSLGILANENLITNIGSGPDSTHGMRRGGPYDRMLTRPLDLPLRHPPFIVRDAQADHFTSQTLFNFRLSRRLKLKLIRGINRMLEYRKTLKI